MNLEESRKQIMTSDEFVVSELLKVQYLYGLKKEIRYGTERNLESDTESVAEHIFGMHCLIDYFAPLENPDADWDMNRIRQICQYHDIDEIETGDVVGYLKSQAACTAERNAAEIAISRLPDIMHSQLRSVLDEYESQQTVESQFVKALDKIEPVFQLYNEAGKETLARLKTTKDQHDRIKFPYVQNFPYIMRFAEVMTEQFKSEGYYHG